MERFQSYNVTLFMSGQNEHKRIRVNAVKQKMERLLCCGEVGVTVVGSPQREAWSLC